MILQECFMVLAVYGILENDLEILPEMKWKVHTSSNLAWNSLYNSEKFWLHRMEAPDQFRL